ncbi:MAG: hypothetical protein ACI4DK_07115 [Lachnospiraceae bacterium]
MKKKPLFFIPMLVIIITVCGILVANYINQKNEERLSTIANKNMSYRDCLFIKGVFTYDIHGVTYSEGKKFEKKYLYERIAFIHVFNPEYEVEYTSIDELLYLYDVFCETGDAQDKLDEFCLANEKAESRAYSTALSFNQVESIINYLGAGLIDVIDGEVVENSDYSSRPSEDDILEACKKYETNSEILNEWYIMWRY